MKKIVTVLLIICLVFTLLPDKKSVEAAYVIDDALLITVGALLIASGYAFANRDKVAAIAKDCYLKMPKNLKDAVQTMKAIGIITWNPVLMNYLKNYKTDTFNAIMGGLGLYKIGGLADREMHLVKQGLISFDNTLTAKTEKLTVSDMTPIYGSGIFVLDVMFVYGGFSLKNIDGLSTYYLIHNQDGYYSYLDENSNSVNIISNCPTGKGYGNTSHTYTTQPVTLTFFLHRGLRDMKLLYGGNVLNMKKYNPNKSVDLQMSNISGVADRARLQYRLYEVEDDYLTIDDMVIYEPRVDILEDDVVFGPAMEGMQDMVITVPQLADVADLVDVNTSVLEGVEAGVSGILGVLNAIKVYIMQLVASITGFFDLSKPIVWSPVTGLGEQLTMVFPFSLPWDVGRAINALNVPGELPDDMEVKMNVYNKEYKFDIVWPEFVSTMAAMTRSAVMLLFIIGMIYATGRLFGGVQ